MDKKETKQVEKIDKSLNELYKLLKDFDENAHELSGYNVSNHNKLLIYKRSILKQLGRIEKAKDNLLGIVVVKPNPDIIKVFKQYEN